MVFSYQDTKSSTLQKYNCQVKIYKHNFQLYLDTSVVLALLQRHELSVL